MISLALPYRNLLVFLIFIACCILLVAVALTVYFNNRRSPVNRHFFYYLCAIIAWSLPPLVYAPFEIAVAELLLVQMAAGSLIGPLFYYFSRALGDERYRVGARELPLLLPFAVILVCNGVRLLDPAMLARFREGVAMRDLVLSRRPDAVYALYSATLIVCTVMGLVVSALAWRREQDPERRRRNAWIFWIMAITWSLMLVAVNIMTLLGIDTSAVFVTFTVTGAIAVIGILIVRQRAWSSEHLLDLLQKRERQLELANEELSTINRELIDARDISRRDLAMAINVQRNFLPAMAPRDAAWDLAFHFHPMAGVSGDFYDFYCTAGALRGVGIFDVSGHGISSALVTMIARSTFLPLFQGR